MNSSIYHSIRVKQINCNCRIKYLLLLLSMILFVSCSKEEPTDGMLEEVSQYVSSHVTYSNYSWDISMDSFLESVYSDKIIKYGILCGYNGEPYYYSKYFTLIDSHIESVEPLFVDGNGSPYITQYLYWNSLIALQNKGTLTSTERGLKNDILNDFRTSEPKAKSVYWGQLFVDMDGTKYIVKEFGNKKEEYDGSNNDSNGNSGGNSFTSEKPEVGFYDFTATKTSLKVQYKIYNKDEAGVKSAKIYYGTTSNPTTSKTASVSGTLITANITGLKAGTTYYVKCSVTGKSGTTTTEVTKCITNN